MIHADHDLDAGVIIGRVRVVAARLTQLLNLPPDIFLNPMDPALLPLTLVPEETSLNALLTQGLANRPELAENRAVSQAALERLRAAQWAPLLPHLEVSVSAGGFGGGPNSFFGHFNGRNDVAASASDGSYGRWGSIAWT